MARTGFPKRGDPIFNRSDVARILNVTPLTISNREKRKQYPQPKRDLNGYRIYTLSDVLDLQLITYSAIDTNPIISVLYDKGWRDPKGATEVVDKALSRRTRND